MTSVLPTPLIKTLYKNHSPIHSSLIITCLRAVHTIQTFSEQKLNAAMNINYHLKLFLSHCKAIFYKGNVLR